MRFLNLFMLPAVIWLALLLTAGCGDRMPRLTAEETDLVMSSDGVMRVLLVTSPELAAPQVGLNRRVVAVMRYDKPGYPFEVYPNIHIEHFSDQKQTGPEGCLSIPEIAGDVERSQQVVIRYTDPETLSEVRETVDGYTAVIFQHEVDHLDGILFTDRLTVPAGSGR